MATSRLMYVAKGTATTNARAPFDVPEGVDAEELLNGFAARTTDWSFEPPGSGAYHGLQWVEVDEVNGLGPATPVPRRRHGRPG